MVKQWVQKSNDYIFLDETFQSKWQREFKLKPSHYTEYLLILGIFLFMVKIHLNSKREKKDRKLNISMQWWVGAKTFGYGLWGYRHMGLSSALWGTILFEPLAAFESVDSALSVPWHIYLSTGGSSVSWFPLGHPAHFFSVSFACSSFPHPQVVAQGSVLQLLFFSSGTLSRNTPTKPMASKTIPVLRFLSLYLPPGLFSWKEDPYVHHLQESSLWVSQAFKPMDFPALQTQYVQIWTRHLSSPQLPPPDKN